MKTAKESNIEAILPLTEMQEGILIHHLHSTWDEGFLHVEFGIQGALEREYLEKAWDLIVDRHEILRTSVHWENIEKPLQVIHKSKEAIWHFHDWSGYNTTEQKEHIAAQKLKNREIGLDFKKHPLLNFHLITLGKASYHFLWPCHHLLLDGWSGSNIIKDVFANYNALCKGESIKLETLPSLKSYYGWLKKKDPQETSNFWSDYFKNFEAVHLFNTAGTPFDPSKRKIIKFSLSVQETEALNAFAKKSKITLNTVIQGAWTLLLSVFFQSNDIVFGTSVSGRSNDFPNMDKLSGVFTNILPIRGILNEETLVGEWLQEFQIKQLKALKYGHVTQNEITTLVEDVVKSTLFDNLLVFENYPGDKIKSGEIEIQNFKSGLTTNYPLSLIIIPHSQIAFTFLYQSHQISPETSTWMTENLKDVLKMLESNDAATTGEIKAQLVRPENLHQELEVEVKTVPVSNYIAPRNTTEAQLVSIWEGLLDRKEFGVCDNYFELGGKSLMALKMFSQIESELQVKLPVTSLLFNPTIEQLAIKIAAIQNDEQTPDWEFLIPLRPEGNRAAVFCIHGGEGHVLFYKQLSEYLHKDRPIYLIQPKGIDGEGPMHQSIEEMSTDYINEILRVEGINSFNLVFYCYSAMVVEMTKQLQEKGKSFRLIVIDSWGRSKPNTVKRTFLQRTNTYLKSFSRSPVLAIRNSLLYRYRRWLEPRYLKWTNNTVKIKLARIRKQLRYIYYRYQWKKFDAPLTLIFADKEHPKLNEEKLASWKYWTKSEIKAKNTPGNHFSMFQEPHVKKLAKNIEESCN